MMKLLAARSEELTVHVQDMVVLSHVGAETGLDGTTIARDVVGGWRRSAQVNAHGRARKVTERVPA